MWIFVWQDSAAENEKENKEEKEEEEKKEVEKEKKKEEEKEKEKKKEEEEEAVSQIITVMTMYLIIVGYHFVQKKEFITVAEEYEYFNR